MENKIKVNIGKDNLVYLSIGEVSSDGMDPHEINGLIDMLTCARNDSKELKGLRKKEFSILKDYNSEGKVLEEKK